MNKHQSPLPINTTNTNFKQKSFEKVNLKIPCSNSMSSRQLFTDMKHKVSENIITIRIDVAYKGCPETQHQARTRSSTRL